MKPAFSIVFFTVVSGAALGLLALLGVVALFDLPWLSAPARRVAGVLGIALALAGFASSTLHLANPRNAWRSFSRFRTSWLSREAVFALAFVGVALVFVALLWLSVDGPLRRLFALSTIVLAWTVLVCTAMIYASLKPIRQWHTRWTPVAYVVLGHWSGALILLAVARHDASDGARLAQLCVALALLAAAVKVGYWRAARDERRAITLERAIGVAQGVGPPAAAAAPSVMQARLLDAGHGGRTFLTDEFVFRLARQRRGWLLAAFWGAGIAVPLLWVAGAWGQTPVAAAACAANVLGLFAERTLFFADARHTVRLFHGERRT